MRHFDMSKTPLVLASIIRIIASHNKLRRAILAVKALNNTVGKLPRKAQKEMAIVSRLCVCALISLSLFLGCATETPRKVEAKALVEGSMREVVIRPGGPIHIACWMVISGRDASLGTDTKRGVEIAVDDVGGKLLGHPIEITTQDTRCNAEGGQAAATKLASDPTIVAAVGSNCSSAATPGAPILWKAGIVTVSPSNTDPRLTDPKRGSQYEGYLRTSWNDKVHGKVAAEFLSMHLKLTNAATISDGSIYSEEVRTSFTETFENLGGTVIVQETIAPTETNMGGLLNKIAASDAEAIYFPIFVAAGSRIVRQAREIPALQKVVLISADGTFTPDFYKKAGDAAVGMYHSCPDFSSFDRLYMEFVSKYRQRYGRKPIAPFHAFAYDAAMMIFAAVEKVAKRSEDGTLSIDRKELRDSLYGTKDFPGLTGNLTCTPTGDCGDFKIGIFQTTEKNVNDLKLPDRVFWKPY